MPIALPVAIGFTLDLAVLAIVGLLLIIAAGTLAGLLARWFSAAPWPLSVIGSGAAAAFASAVYDGIRWATASAEGLAQVITAPFQALWSVIWYTIEAGNMAAMAVWKVRYQVLPAVESALISWTQALVGAEASARQLADQLVIRYAQAAAAAAEAYARALAQQLASYVQQLVGLESRARASGDQAVAQYAQGAALAAEGYARALDEQAIGYVDQVAGSILGFVGGAILGAERYAEGIGIAAEDYARAGDVATGAAAAAGIGAAAAAAAAGIAAVGSRVQELEDSPCQQHCGPLGDLGQLLQGLEDVGLEAVLLALLAEAQQHPGDLVQALDQTLGAAARAAGHELQLGIPG